MAASSRGYFAQPQFPRNTGRNAHIFQPPKSPASTTTSPAYATAPDYFSPRSRKRQRPDSSHSLHEAQTPGPQEPTPWALTPSWVQCPTPGDGIYGSASAHSSALVNERYRLAGGFDTPGIMATTEQELDSRDADDEFRRRVRDMDHPRQQHVRDGTMLAGPLARERNGVARMQSSPNGEQNKAGWTSFAFGLVGKVFNFSTSMIKGFYAGGGKGYEFHQQTSPYGSWVPSRLRGHTPVPGSWQEESEFLGDFEQDNPTFSPTATKTRPPNKRRQTDRDSWVMVGTPDGADLSPKRKSSSTSIPRSSLAARPTASRTNSRRSLAPVSRRQSSFVLQNCSPAIQPAFGDPSHRRASFAPMRSPHSNSRPNSAGAGRPSSAGLAAGVSPEAERLVKRQAKQEKVTDRTMNSMNRQLKDLIQQAQAALGTKYEVECAAGGEDMDEGYVDEEWE